MALAPQLLEHLSPEFRERLQIESELEPRLARLVADARAERPELDVPEKLIATVAAALSEPSLAAFDQLRAGDLLVACAALAGDVRAIRIVDQLLERLGGIIRSAGLSPHEVDDVKQQLRERLLLDEGTRRAKLASYAGRGPLEHWLRIVAVRHAREWREAQHGRDHLVETFISALQPALRGDPELEYARDKLGGVFRDALGAAIVELAPEDRELIRQVVDGTSPEDLGKALGVHRTTAIRRFDRARQELRDGLRAQLGKRLHIDRFAVDSVLRLYDAGFRIDLAAMLDDR